MNFFSLTIDWTINIRVAKDSRMVFSICRQRSQLNWEKHDELYLKMKQSFF